MKLDYPYQNFYQILEANAASIGDKTAIFIDDEKITYAQFLKKVDAFARFLEISGIQRKDRVALIAPNSEEFVITVFAATKIGAIVIPVNNMLKLNEFEYILNDAEAKLLVTSNQFAKEVVELEKKVDTLKRVVWIDDAPFLDEKNVMFDEVLTIRPHIEEPVTMMQLDDEAVIFYTSGTTGKPKGALMSYRNLFSNMIGGQQVFNVNEKDRFIVYLPMFHSFTFTVMTLMPFFAKSSVVIVRKLLPFSNIIKQTLLKRVTVFLGVPDIYNALIRAKLPWYFLWFNNIRLFISGASALSEDTLMKFRQIFKRANMSEGYGLSENSPAAAVNPMDRQKVLSVGKALPGYEIKIVDEEFVEVPRGHVGEIIISGDGVMKGYLNRPEATAETIVNGWLRTGDLGKMDEDGYLYIVDRMKDLIISKGINIYPREIEEELMKLDYVKAAAVIGVSDPKNGEVPIAFLELEDEFETIPTQADVKAALKAELANFKIPKTINFVDELPKTATGKVLKRILKKEYAG
ncbi:MAG: long-chain fatty acid--CoA ligase [Helicobacteraceae bacterium 4484_230]|nr:MAG: long-chain fatty acid--CoA ligase [Helicobacteraceae bacterium 4484_230]